MRSKRRLAGKSATVIGLICLVGAVQPVSAFDLSTSPFLGPNPAGQLDATELIPDCLAPKCLVDPSILASGDFVGDSKPDLIVAATVMDRQYRELDKAGPIVLMENLGGYFKAVQFSSGPLFRKHPRDARVADFNGDGRADVLVVSNGYDVAPWSGERLALLLSEGGTLVDRTANLPNVVAHIREAEKQGSVKIHKRGFCRFERGRQG